MFAKASKLSAPVAGAILLASLCFAPVASAAPFQVDRSFQPVNSERVIKIDHRWGPGRHGGGWNNGRGWGYRELGPRQIRRSLRHRGFYRIKILDRRGPMYIVKAIGWRGMPMRLVVDSRTADIVRSRPVGHRKNWQYRW